MEQINKILEYKILAFSGHEVTLFQIVVVLVLLLIVKIVSRSIGLIVKRRADNEDFDEGKKFSVIKLMNYLLYTIAIVMGLEVLGFDVSILLAGSAALLVGIGLGIQDIFRDFISGIIILFDYSIKVGDVIEINNLVGVVKEIDIRTSKVRTRDGIIIIVPNGSFINQNVINWTNSNKLTRFNIDVGVAYGSDVRLVEKVLLACLENVKPINTRPTPFVRFNNFGSSSLEFQLYFWTEEVWMIEQTKSELRFAIDEEFRKEKIIIAFPQLDVHMKREV